MPGSTIGSLIGWGLGAYGRKPKVPSLREISPTTVQQQTVAGNIAGFGDAAKLATMYNQFNQNQLAAAFERQLPGGTATIQRNILSQLSGEIPEDVSKAIQRSVAERGVAGGFSGSGFGRNLTARDLGLTSLGIKHTGFDSAMKWLQASSAPTFDVRSMFFTPDRMLAFEEQQQQLQFQRDLMGAEIKAAPDPWRVALAQGFDADINNINAAISSFGGKAAGAAGAAAGGGGMSY